MSWPSDDDYKETKLIKRGERAVSAHFDQLVRFIHAQFETTVLNIVYDTIEHQELRPRLNVIVEREASLAKFKNKTFGYNAKAQRAVADHCRRVSSLPFDVENVFVIFTAFDRVAKIEANEGIPESEIERLQSTLHNDELWTISRFASGATFFLYTDAQVKKNGANGYIQQVSTKYYEVLRAYDEFNYFDPDHFLAALDSKENFDTNYKSNWRFYYA